MSTKQVGDRGEALAAAYLREQGYQVVARNYRFQRAEVDLICVEPAGAQQDREVVFVEVKTRRGIGFGRPEEAVTEAKQQQITKVAEAFLYERQLENAPCRFDVVAIVLGGNGHEIEHFEDAFWAGS